MLSFVGKKELKTATTVAQYWLLRFGEGRGYVNSTWIGITLSFKISPTPPSVFLFDNNGSLDIVE